MQAAGQSGRKTGTSATSPLSEPLRTAGMVETCVKAAGGRRSRTRPSASALHPEQRRSPRAEDEEFHQFSVL